MSDWNPFDHHRGPYQLQVLRPKPHATKTYPFRLETLTGVVDGDDVAEEATALLTDPRDTIVSVYVWSVHEQQHVTTYTRQAVR